MISSDRDFEYTYRAALYFRSAVGISEEFGVEHIGQNKIGTEFGAACGYCI
jgi:hypothetical protein